ncbi:ATPase domain-containing protein [Halofilum ochraceum]|uniref:ATPase domain-containing protein n=1 Tax=Halofilum ochraceum TaxID=1611323 RepID=UPI0008D95D19|nr:ATPase domain-containing protein [Halofilum ochraceum]
MNDGHRDGARISTGVSGLDEILHGGLIAGRNYLVRGGPGTGKTTLGSHFLRGGDPARNLFVTLGETETQLRENGRRASLPLDAVSVLDLSPTNDEAGSGQPYNLLESWEVEGGAIHDRVIDYTRQYAPERVFIDSLSQLRYLTPDAFQFRKQALSLLRHLTAAGATVLFTAEVDAGAGDDDLQFLSDGVLELSRLASGRVCAVTKMRGSGFAEGTHYYGLGDGGMSVYPRLVPGNHSRDFVRESFGTGIPRIDSLMQGGIERGTVTVLSGPSGVGKTSLGAHFMRQAARSGERSVIYSFDEGRSTFEHRLEQIGMPIADMLDSGELVFEYIEPLNYNPDRFALRVRDAVERLGVQVVMLDSLSGYRQAVRGDDIAERIHALCRYLANMGVTVILINETQSVAGSEFRATHDGISYLADSIVLLRYVELEGELRKTIGVLKKRTGDFEKSLRAFEITPEGLQVGEPMRGLQGVLRGVAEKNGHREDGGHGGD